MATRKRTVITEETHEVWIIRHGVEADESVTSTEATSQSVEFEPTLVLEPIEKEDE